MMQAICTLHALPYQADPGVYFARLRREEGAILLDSGRPAAVRGRYDVLSAWPLACFEAAEGESGTQFFERLRAALATLGRAEFDPARALPFAGGLLGYMAYDFGRRLEASIAGKPQAALPDAHFGLYDWALISDHVELTSTLVFHPACPEERRRRVLRWFDTPATPPGPFHLSQPFEATTTREHYRDAIARIHDYISAGDCYQVNYTQRFQAGYEGDPWAAYCALRRACPTPFSGYVNLGQNDAILSLSPERFVRLEDGHIETRPIKGTRPRGATPRQDAQLAHELCTSVKDRAENVMIVDLLRNDIGRSSQVGSVQVPELCSLESYPNVHHLVSSVRAELADGLDVFDLLAGSFPGGSITGAPKIRAMQIIDELEPHVRSVYCGSLLYIDVRGNMDSSITIRSLLAQQGRISCWGGGGIVMDSDWQEEYQESLDKVNVLLRTLEAM